MPKSHSNYSVNNCKFYNKENYQKLLCSRDSDFKTGDLKQMWVISNIFFVNKLSEMLTIVGKI